MGLLDLFSKEGRAGMSLKRASAKAVHKHIQSPDRMKALEALYGAGQDGNEEAIAAMLRRFSFVYDKTIEDEQEKDWVYQALCSLGEKALPPLRRYLSQAVSISWPLRVLEQVASPEEIWATVESLMEEHEPGYERDPTVKQQLISFVSDLKDAKGVALVTPYLEDMDEGVRFQAVEALLKLKDGGSRDALCAHFVGDQEDSLRIRVLIAEGFARLGWDVVGFRGQFEKLLPDGFTLDKQGHVKRKGKRAAGDDAD